MSNKASIQVSFQNHIQALAVQSLQEGARLASPFTAGQPIPSPENPLGAELNRDSPIEIAAVFDRSDVNANFEEVVGGSDPGTVADIISLKEQNDFIAARERAFLLSSCSAVRSRVHSTLRRVGCGAANGVFLGSVSRRATGPLSQTDQRTETGV